MSNQKQNPYNNRNRETIEQHYQSIALANAAIDKVRNDETNDVNAELRIDYVEIARELKTLAAWFVFNTAVLIMSAGFSAALWLDK